MTDLVKTYWWRHGETEWNAQKKWQGHSDIPLNEKGRIQAVSLAELLKDVPLEFIISSDLNRAFHTAKTVAESMGLEILTHEALREGHFGRAEGLTLDQIRSKFGVKLLEEWRSNDERFLDIRFAGGETKREIVTRVKAQVEELLLQYPFKSVGISTHGGVLRKVLYSIDSEIKLPSPIPNCSCFEIHYDKNLMKWQFISAYSG